MKRKKICFVVSYYGSAESFLTDHIKALSEIYDVYAVANLGGKPVEVLPGLVEVKDIAINRGISVGADMRAVAVLARYFRERGFDAVHSVTPKAGLVTALAARLAGVKHRTHIFTGQVWATRKGPMRLMLKALDKVTATLDNHILADGESQRRFLIDEGVVSEKKSRVLGAGSICGANSRRFSRVEGERQRQREAMGIPQDKVVFAFMGRLNREKGIYELLGAFNSLAGEKKEAYLLIFGTDEEDCLSHLPEYPDIKPGVNFHYHGQTPTPNLALQAADAFCLPSYREGFGLSVVEASSLELPVICSDAYGLADTMVEGETGLRCKVGDASTLEKAMLALYDDPEKRLTFGKNGRKRVLSLFKGETIVGEWVRFYRELLG